MKKSVVIIIGIAIIALIIVVYQKKTPPAPANVSSGDTTTPASIVGCYATTGNAPDKYSLSIDSQNGTAVSGTLTFNNYQKDSSTGTFVGTYQDGVLLGDYSFRSEGMDSVMQVAFKREGNTFVRGYGPMDSSGTRFASISTLTYDDTSPLAVFTAGACAATAPHTSIVFPAGGEHLVRGKTYTLSWTGGPASTTIFLIDTSLLSAGTSVSITDRVYNVKNTGSYAYTIPASIKPGVYQFEIGDSTSKTFSIVRDAS